MWGNFHGERPHRECQRLKVSQDAGSRPRRGMKWTRLDQRNIFDDCTVIKNVYLYMYICVLYVYIYIHIHVPINIIGDSEPIYII